MRLLRIKIAPGIKPAYDFRRGIISRFILLVCVSVLLTTPAFALDTSKMTIGQRLERLEAALENKNLVELFLAIENLQKEVEALRGELELMRFDMNNVKKQQKDLYVDIDQRMQQMEVALSNIGSVDQGSGDAEVMPAGMQEQAAYDAAFNKLKKQDYDGAIAAFEEFNKQYPQSAFSPNALYWLGEAYYVKRDFHKAIGAFQMVARRFANSSKVADSLLKVGFSHFELKQWDQAHKVLKEVIAKYSNSTAASLAQRRIQQMRINGNIK